jgi:hypothetical protein
LIGICVSFMASSQLLPFERRPGKNRVKITGFFFIR